MTGWWYTYPSEKYEFVTWDDYSQYRKMFETTNVWNHQPDEYWAFDQFIQYGSYWVILQQYPKMGTNLSSTPHRLIFVSINEFSHLTVMIPCIEASDSPMTLGRGRSSRFFAFWSTNFGGMVIKGYPQWSFSMIFAHFPWLPSGNLT